MTYRYAYPARTAHRARRAWPTHAGKRRAREAARVRKAPVRLERADTTKEEME